MVQPMPVLKNVSSNECSSSGRSWLSERQLEATLKRTSSSASSVVLEDSTKQLGSNKPLTLSQRLTSLGPLAAERTVADALLWLGGIVVGQISRDQEVEMLLSEDNKMPHGLTLDKSYPPLDEGLLIRGLGCRLDDPSLGTLEDLVEFADVHPISVVDEIALGNPGYTDRILPQSKRGSYS